MTNFRFRRAARLRDAVAEALAFLWGASVVCFSVLIMALFFRV